MAAVWPYLWTDQNYFRGTHLDIERKFMQGFEKNSSHGFGGDAITVKMKDGCRRPYLSTDRNHFRPETTRREHLGQVSRQINQLSRRRCDDEKKLIDGRTDGWTLDGPLRNKLYLLVELKMQVMSTLTFDTNNTLCVQFA